MPEKTITVTNGDGTTKTITIPDRSRFAGTRTMSRVTGGVTDTVTVDRTAQVVTSDQQGVSRPLLSKVVGGAAAAWSLRDLNDRLSHSKVVRVRRSSDNNEKDITAKEVPLLTDWVGVGNDGFVSIWYDQSGNGKDIAQPTASKQPKIVDQGNLITNTAGQVSLSFNKDDVDELTIAGGIPLSTGVHSFIYCEDLAGASATHRPLLGGPAGRGIGITGGLGQLKLYHGSAIFTPLPTVTGPKLITALSKPVGANIYENGTLRVSGDVGTLALPYKVGGRFSLDTNTAPDLLISEVIIFKGNQSANRPAIEANINNQYGIY